MATVFSGERLLNVLTFTDDSSLDINPTYTFYTCPANRWAEITVHQVRSGTGLAHNLSKLFMGLIPFNNEGGGNDSLYDGVGATKFPYFNSTGNSGEAGGGSDGVIMRGEVKFILTSSQSMYKATASGGPGNGIAVWCTVKEYANP